MSIKNPLAPPATNPTPATTPTRSPRRNNVINATPNTTAAIAPYTATGCKRNSPSPPWFTIPHGNRVGMPTSVPSKNLPTLNIAASIAAQGAQASITRATASRFHRRYATTTSPVSTIPKVVNDGSASNVPGIFKNAEKFPATSNSREQTNAATTANNPASQTCSAASPTNRAVLKLKPNAATNPTAAQTPYIDTRNGPTRNTRGTIIVAV